MEIYNVGGVAEGLRDHLDDVERNLGYGAEVLPDSEEADFGVYAKVDQQGHIHEEPEQAWFELVTTDGRRFRVTITEAS